MDIRVDPTSRFEGVTSVPGDKSLSHRAQLLAAIAAGRSEIDGTSEGEDVSSTGRCLRALGVNIQREGSRLFIDGVGLRGFTAPYAPLDCGNSGSTIRMLMGMLAAQKFPTSLFGDESLSRRPMNRVAEPLSKMGAKIKLTRGSYAPVQIESVERLAGIDYSLKVASAQVKSAVLLAGLYAEGVTRLTGELHSRDHTERLLTHFGVKLHVTSSEIILRGGQLLHASQLSIPGDPSSAAFWLAGGSLVKNGNVRLPNLLLNPTRTGFFRALKKMGADISEDVTTANPEPVGEVVIRGGAPLTGIFISREEVASLIDELPMLAVLATFAEGATEVRGAEELRVKETDRIEAVQKNFKALGINFKTFPDGFRIEGPQTLKGGTVDSYGDHRIAMAFAIGALRAQSSITIRNAESVAISYPGFFETLRKLSHA